MTFRISSQVFCSGTDQIRVPKKSVRRIFKVMGHDYNLPFGPWGMEVEPQMPLGEQWSWMSWGLGLLIVITCYNNIITCHKPSYQPPQVATHLRITTFFHVCLALFCRVAVLSSEMYCAFQAWTAQQYKLHCNNLARHYFMSDVGGFSCLNTFSILIV